MSGLISRDAAIDALDDKFTIIGTTNAIVVQDYIRRVNNRLRDLPSAEPEIVRCKDCIHSPAAHDDCPLPVQYIVPEGYCHLGEEKDVLR